MFHYIGLGIKQEKHGIVMEQNLYIDSINRLLPFHYLFDTSRVYTIVKKCQNKIYIIIC